VKSDIIIESDDEEGFPLRFGARMSSFWLTVSLLAISFQAPLSLSLFPFFHAHNDEEA